MTFTEISLQFIIEFSIQQKPLIKKHELIQIRLHSSSKWLRLMIRRKLKKNRFIWRKLLNLDYFWSSSEIYWRVNDLQKENIFLRLRIILEDSFWHKEGYYWYFIVFYCKWFYLHERFDASFKYKCFLDSYLYYFELF
jgi:hypothetical protein